MDMFELHENGVTCKLRDLYDQFQIFCKQSDSVEERPKIQWLDGNHAYNIWTKDADY